MMHISRTRFWYAFYTICIRPRQMRFNRIESLYWQKGQKINITKGNQRKLWQPYIRWGLHANKALLEMCSTIDRMVKSLQLKNENSSIFNASNRRHPRMPFLFSVVHIICIYILWQHHVRVGFCICNLKKKNLFIVKVKWTKKI